LIVLVEIVVAFDFGILGETYGSGHMVGILQKHHIDTHKHTDKIAEEKCPVLTIVGGIIEVFLTKVVLLPTELEVVDLIAETLLDILQQGRNCTIGAFAFNQRLDIAFQGQVKDFVDSGVGIHVKFHLGIMGIEVHQALVYIDGNVPPSKFVFIRIGAESAAQLRGLVHRGVDAVVGDIELMAVGVQSAFELFFGTKGLESIITDVVYHSERSVVEFADGCHQDDQIGSDTSHSNVVMHIVEEVNREGNLLVGIDGVYFGRELAGQIEKSPPVQP
jgi:hypothetical protein